ncbi:hypothetical protein B5K06_29130 [Rhizobium grahamii]|uniref:Uncharacterized protein n=1 Tax=Rhizobium grahamii TaxID=1120045 RepID=A0A370KGQ2_9HYPH|nr:hypothetical protein B5K06_29130 [Rhizobium grahamii]
MVPPKASIRLCLMSWTCQNLLQIQAQGTRPCSNFLADRDCALSTGKALGVDFPVKTRKTFRFSPWFWPEKLACRIPNRSPFAIGS